ncbi:MAG: cytochrome P450 [Polyangiales bacterium]
MNAAFPPGPRTFVDVASAFRDFLSDPAGHVPRATKRWGPIVGMRIGGAPIVFVAEPELVGEVLLDREGVFVKDKVTRGLSSFLGQGLLTSEGDVWRRQRKLIAPSLTKKHIASYADTMTRIARAHADALGDGEVRDVHADMTRVTLDIVVETLFGTALTEGYEHVASLMDDLMNDFVEIIQSWRRLFPSWVPFSARRRIRRSGQELDAFILEIIRKRRASGELGDDLLSRLLEARDEAGSGMSDRQLRDEALTLFAAGHETTANALTYALMLLGEHPEIDARVQAELARVLGDRAARSADVSKLELVDAVVKESLRLYPPAYMIGREATRDVRVGDWSLPRGTTVLMSLFGMHHDPRFFPDPEAFRPDRWLDGSTASVPKHVYQPFGGGPRICVGNHFAMMEAVLVLAGLLRRVRYELISRERPRLQMAITMRPVPGLPMRIRVRH